MRKSNSTEENVITLLNVDVSTPPHCIGTMSVRCYDKLAEVSLRKTPNKIITGA